MAAQGAWRTTWRARLRRGVTAVRRAVRWLLMPLDEPALGAPAEEMTQDTLVLWRQRLAERQSGASGTAPGARSATGAGNFAPIPSFSRPLPLPVPTMPAAPAPADPFPSPSFPALDGIQAFAARMQPPIPANPARPNTKAIMLGARLIQRILVRGEPTWREDIADQIARLALLMPCDVDAALIGMLPLEALMPPEVAREMTQQMAQAWPEAGDPGWDRVAHWLDNLSDTGSEGDGDEGDGGRGVVA